MSTKSTSDYEHASAEIETAFQNTVYNKLIEERH